MLKSLFKDLLKVPRIQNGLLVILSLILLIIFSMGLMHLEGLSTRQQAGLSIYSVGFLLLAAFLCARFFKFFRFPKISGYIFTGVLAGPYVTGFLSHEMVQRLQMIDDLALSFIALSAGGALRLKFIRQNYKVILLNIIFIPFFVFSSVASLSLLLGASFSFTANLTKPQMVAFALLLGVAACAISPSSAMAVISECRARGKFTETVLGVTIAIDVLVIVLFTIMMTLVRTILSGDHLIGYQTWSVLFFEMGISFAIGAIIGKAISFYMSRIKQDLPLFLLFIAFGATKTAFWLSHFMEEHYFISLHLEPLLICMSAGFFVQNFSAHGELLEIHLENMALPIYVLFFSVAGAALNLEALILCWPLALFVVSLRGLSIFCATFMANTLGHSPARHRKVAFMAFLSQAGVAIGLSQLVQRKYPQVGIFLTTVVLALIAIHQVIGPMLLKFALNLVDETDRSSRRP